MRALWAIAIARARALWATPLGKILALALLLRLVGPFWGLPNVDGWDDDGIAPRDFLPGVLQTYWPGQHYTYPPVHLILLTLASAPVWLTTLLHAPSLSPAAVVTTFINVQTMTALAIIGRLVAAGLSIGLLWNAAKIGEELRGQARAGAWVAAACGLNAAFTYYSQSTNLDGPYLFWGVWALRDLVGAIVHRRPAALRRALLLAALAVATKDQAYALFLVSVPVALGTWLALDRDARAAWRSILKETAIGGALGVLLILAIDGAITNPSGFRDRLQFLVGPGSQDHAYYAKTWAGRALLLRHLATGFVQFYPLVFAPMAAVGLVAAMTARDGARRAAGLVPLLAALSFTLAFNMTARRTETRFALPQSMMVGIYAGLALDASHTWLAGRSRPRWLTAGFVAGVAGVLGTALFGCVTVDVAMALDPRYDAEAWMRSHVRPGERVEVYDNNVHLPRFPPGALVERVDATPVASRNPMPGVREVDGRLSDIEARRPDYIVVSEFWTGKFLMVPEDIHVVGLVPSIAMINTSSDADSRAYFHALLDGKLNYQLAHTSRWTSTFWPRVDIHASLTREVRIFSRKEGT